MKRLLPVFALLFIVFLLNTFHEEYSDEYDSMVGGRYILEGRLPYRDWFQHHQPGAYVVAAGIQLFTGISFVRFRIGLAVFWFLLAVGSYFFLWERIMSKGDKGSGGGIGVWVGYILIAAIGATYWWGHMLLADTLSAAFFVPAYAYIIYKETKGNRWEMRDIGVVSFLLFLTWWTSMTSVVIVAGLSAFIIYKRKSVSSVGIVLLPYIVFFAVLFVTGSLPQWYFANVTYNQNYYIYNYPRPEGSAVNPIRYSIVIINAFVQNYLPAVSGFTNFALSNPFQVAVAIGHAGMWLYLVLRKQWLLAFVSVLTVIFTTARVNPQSLRETDYQASSYILLGIFHLLFSLYGFRMLLDEKKRTASIRTIAGAGLLVTGLYATFMGYQLTASFLGKMVPKYMGTAPLIYDRPDVAPILNNIVSKDEYAWVGPFSFEELYYLHAKVPSKYHWFLQHANSSDKIRKELLADFERNKPLIIVFQRDYAPWGGDASGYNKFFTDFLDAHYVLLPEGYRWRDAKQGDFMLGKDINILKEKQTEMIQRLLERQLIEKI